VVLEWSSDICHSTPVVVVRRTEERLRFEVDRGKANGGPDGCDDAEVFWRFLIHLADPVGSRSVRLVIE
jgi:hypothetical protein